MNQRAGQRDALFLSAGEGCWPVAGAVFQANAGQRLQGGITPLPLQPKTDVVYHRFPRQQPRVLEHHATVFLDLRQRR